MTLRHKPVSTLLLAIAIAFIGIDGFADERGQSIMFGDSPGMQTDDPIGSSHTPLTSLQKTDDQCKQLSDEIERLKGKPQRRYSAQQRFNAECRPQHTDD